VKKFSKAKSFTAHFFISLKKSIKKPKIAILGLIVLAVLGFFLWRGFKKGKQVPQFQTAKVERGTIVSSVSASGQVLSVNIMSASTKASGIVKEVYVKDGDVVNVGDKILEITLDQQGKQKNAQAWASYLSAKNTLAATKATQYSLQADMFGEWDSFKKLAESDDYEETDGSPKYEQRTLPEFHIPEKDWLASEAKYKNQQAVISQAQAAINSNWLSYQLASPVITAPANGTITSLMFAEGMSIGTLDTGNTTSNQKVATIKTEGAPIISVNLSEIDVSHVEIDQKATIILDSILDKTFTGKVVGVDRIGQSASGVTQYPTIIQLDSSSDKILPNMTVTASIIIAVEDDTLLVPSGAVIEKDGQTLIRLLEKNRQQTVPVEVGLSSETQTEIISGVEEGTEVIIGIFSKDVDMTTGESPFSRTKGGMGSMIKGGPPH